MEMLYSQEAEFICRDTFTPQNGRLYVRLLIYMIFTAHTSVRSIDRGTQRSGFCISYVVGLHI